MFKKEMERQPDAVAHITGSQDYSDINGIVRFYQTDYGVIVFTLVSGLPYTKGNCKNNIFAYHIHDGNVCDRDKAVPFSLAGTKIACGVIRKNDGM